MTPEDLNQIRALVREEIAAAEHRMTERQERSMEALKLSMTERQERSTEALTANLSDLRDEMNARFDKTDARFDTLERRTDRMETHLQSLILQTAGMNKSLTDAERIDSNFAATQSAQQRAIDDLAARVAKLERERR